MGKAFIFLCLVAAAMAEADPQFLYNSYSSYYPSTYAYGGAYSPYTHGNFYGTLHFYKSEAEAEADPALVYSTGGHYPMTYGIHNYGYSHAYPYTYGYAHHYGKRDAEAEPQYVYSSGVHYPMTYGLHNYGYTHYPYTYGYHHALGKREAEAEPQYVYSSGVHYPYTSAYSHIFKREAEAEPQYGYYGNYYSRPYGYSRTYGYSSYRPYSYGRFGYRGYY